MDSKETLRQQVRRDMRAWWAEVKPREQALAKFAENLLVYLQTQSGVWAGFKSLHGEPSLEKVFTDSKVRWVFPRVENEELSFWAPRATSSFVTGAFGIQEPDTRQSQRIDLGSIDGFVIPGLAFDKLGARLGKGKSFYDRALAKYSGVKVGDAFHWQVREKLPTDPWDVFMDALVTDHEVFRVQK